MNIATVMDEIGDALKVPVPKLRVTPYYAGSLTPPGAIVGLPDTHTFDATMGRGTDHATFPIIVVVGKADAKSARDKLAAYANGTGAASVKAAVEGHEYTACDPPAVRSIEYATSTIGGVEYLSATFLVDVYGTGE